MATDKELTEFDDDGLTEEELESLKESLKEAILIKKGELKPLSMDDLWVD